MDDAGGGYVLGSSAAALQRLADLSRLYAGVTGAWLDALELPPGSTVVDLGCGRGDVSLAVAERVGPTGAVTGVDSAGPALELARHRAAGAGLRQVRFAQGDVTTWTPPAPVDAVVGRLILMHLPDPVALLARLRGAVRPGGVVAFQEVVLTTRAAQPPLPLLTAFNRWLTGTLQRLGRPVDAGLQLAGLYGAAGLPAPVLLTGQPVERGGGADGWAVVAGDVRTLLPRMVELGVTTAAEVDPGTFEQRLRAAADAQDAVLLSPLMVGAVARLR